MNRIPLYVGILACLLATGAALSGAARAGGGEPPDLVSGRALAETRCSHCHAVGRVGESPISIAPAFRHLGRKWPVENLAEALAEGIVVGHPAMPAFAFSPPEIDDFLGWLQSIQEQ